MGKSALVVNSPYDEFHGHQMVFLHDRVTVDGDRRVTGIILKNKTVPHTGMAQREYSASEVLVKMYTIDKVYACIDCGTYVANGEVENPESSWTPDAVEELSEMSVFLANGNDDIDFSWAPCSVCGSTLGGARMEVVIGYYIDPVGGR